MGKLTFPLPSRRKKAPPHTIVTSDSQKSSKAHKILGSAPVSIDSPGKAWDDEVSSSGISINISECSTPTFLMPSRGRLGNQVAIARSRSEWGEDSDVLPPQFQFDMMGEMTDDGAADASSTLRNKPSSSTIKSWYDKSKQPLHVSQQTSASAMAKGLPPKAQRLLDMDHNHALKSKKKPSRLDFSSLVPGSRSFRKDSDANIFVQSADPRPVPLASRSQPNSPGQRRRLQKRPTKENLAAIAVSEQKRPSTSGRLAGAKDHDALPDLYQHYEQMSLRQLMDLEAEKEQSILDAESQEAPPAMASQPVTRPQQTGQRQGSMNEKPRGHAPQLSQAVARSPLDRSSLVDYPASISSRHTRTSKATAKTDSRSQDSDLQDKSVLLLYSDSDDEVGDEPVSRLERPHTSQPQPERQGEVRVVSQNFMTRYPMSQGPESERSSQSSRIASFPSPPRQYRASSRTSRHGESLPSAASPASPPRRSAYQALFSPSRSTMLSTSSGGTYSTRQSKAVPSIYEARAVPMLPTQATPSDLSDEDSDTAEGPQTFKPAAHPSSQVPFMDQPTPPLSPSTVDAHVRSAHSSVNVSSPTTQNRFMAVTRQEEILLSALRQKRQIMRENAMADWGGGKPSERCQPSGHHSKASDATTRATAFDFDFPEPPSTNRRPSEVRQSKMSYGWSEAPSRGSDSYPSGENRGSKGLSPAPWQRPASHLSSATIESLNDPEVASSMAEVMDGLAQLGGSALSTNRSSLVSPRSRRQNELLAARRSTAGQEPTAHAENFRRDHAWPDSISEVDEDVPKDVPKEVPRPDSPVAGGGHPMLSQPVVVVNKKAARLSAVGPAPLANGPTWWGDDDDDDDD